MVLIGYFRLGILGFWEILMKQFAETLLDIGATIFLNK